MVFLSIIVLFGILTNFWYSQRWKHPMQFQTDIFAVLCMLIGSIFGVFTLCLPNHASNVVLLCSFIKFLFINSNNYWKFEGNDMSGESVSEQVKYYKAIFDIKSLIVNLYMIQCIFLTPFLDKFFFSFISSSI